MSFNITQPVKVVNPVANVDSDYGTYTTLATALAAIPKALRKEGKTVAIRPFLRTDSVSFGSYVVDTDIFDTIEYQWKLGIEDADLVLKNPVFSGQDNIKRIIDFTFPDNVRDYATPEQLATAINSLDKFSITETDLPIFKAVSRNGSIWYVELINVGKGNYSIEGTISIDEKNIKISVEKQPETIRLDADLTLDATYNEVYFSVKNAVITIPFAIQDDMRISGYTDSSTCTITPEINVNIFSKNGLLIPANTTFTLTYNYFDDTNKHWTLDFEVEKVELGVNNSTTVMLTSAQLNMLYPTKKTGFKVYCNSIIDSKVTYEKTPTEWTGVTVFTP